MKYLNSNPLDKLHDGEPYFFVRAADELALPSLLAYIDQLLNEGDNDGADEVDKIVGAFYKWRKENPTLVKKPD